ncbi:CatA-like O-acetyltransferase [Niveispirillum lacus]|uniref:CatA-like O-acetyltransferase n=1 Tax=Niveispirillum lacus TaxID=1981099 RepID=UPI0013FE16CC|nr:CatA-like O-acetyltransferase [Niveispirillum lacus]
MIDRSRQIALFDRYDQPAVNIAAVADCPDFVTPAKEAGIPPFARVLHAIGRASLDIPHMRLRLLEKRVSAVASLTLSYTVIGRDQNLNFSTIPYDSDFRSFLAAYLTDRELARNAVELRLKPLTNRDYIFATCLPWLRFTSIQHPMARFGDCSIPNIAIGKFGQRNGRVDFPVAVQAHHGLVDGLHIAQFIARLEEVLAEAVNDPTR